MVILLISAANVSTNKFENRLNALNEGSRLNLNNISENNNNNNNNNNTTTTNNNNTNNANNANTSNNLAATKRPSFCCRA